MGLEYYVAVPSPANLSFLGALMRSFQVPGNPRAKTMVSSREQGKVGGEVKGIRSVPRVSGRLKVEPWVFLSSTIRLLE